MLRRLTLRDVVIVSQLEVELDAGFSVLTGETGAGKSILIDALQLALGGRGDAGLVREGCARAEVTAEFDTPAGAGGLAGRRRLRRDGDSLLLRRSVDAQGKSRAWINGSPATLAQLREAGEQLVDIHGQHAWQSLTRPGRGARPARRAGRRRRARRWARLASLEEPPKRRWPMPARAARPGTRARTPGLADRRTRQAGARRQRMGRTQRRAPAPGPCAIAARRRACARLLALSDGEPAADALAAAPSTHSTDLTRYDARLAEVVEVLQRRTGAVAGRRAQPARLPGPQRARPGAAGRAGCAAVGLAVAGPTLPPHASRAAGAAGRLEGGDCARSTPRPTWTHSSARGSRQASAGRPRRSA